MKIMSWNIRFARGRDMRPSTGAILDALDADAPDIALLQEAEVRFGRASSLPLAELSRRGWRPVAPAAPRGLGYRGCAILLRGPLRAAEAVHLPLRGFETRGALVARIEGGAVPLSVACVHLGLLSFHRRQQLAAVLEALHRLPGPHAVIGDTNEWRGDRWLALPDGWRVLPTGKTFPTKRPRLRLDRICLGPGLRGEVDGRPLPDAVLRASDHVPIRARLARG
jgi:endonuclease/exonuclease/phosphatase family metal-dependent hydrolase